MSDSPIDRLKDVIVTLRSELRVTRTLFRGEPSYIVRDPITFGATRFLPNEYGVVMEFDGKKTLSEVFDLLVERGLAQTENEEAYYTFVLDLQRSGLLNLPVSDDSALYERFAAKKNAAKRQKLTGFLSLQISLFSPDAFLERTLRYVGWLFTRWAFGVWCVMMSVAAIIAIARWSELTAPILTLLENSNLPWLAAILMGLKIFHESGHAYACKAFGGKVPDVGALFIVFAPCAYVDASAAWGFQSKMHRMIVSLGGMYIESIFACIALFIWATTDPSFINSMAYQTLMMASVVTVLFNLNPLMKFDGYYLTSDLFEIPNMRQRCANYVTRLFDGWILGIPQAPDPETKLLRTSLTLFGLASTVYKVTLTLSICGLIMSKVYFLGFLMAAYYTGSAIFGFVKKSWTRLASEEFAHVRHRSMTFGGLTLAVVAVGGFCIPVAPPVVARGVVQPEVEEVLRVQSPGYFEGFGVRVGDRVSEGTVIARLENPELREHAVQARLKVVTVEKERRAAEIVDPAQALRTARTESFLREALADSVRGTEKLVVRSTIEGEVLSTPGAEQLGRFLQEGDELARVGSGGWIVTLLLSEQEFHDSEIEVGGEISCRLQSELSRHRVGRVVEIAKAGTREIGESALTNVAGGDIVIDPSSGQATSAYFKVTLTLDADEDVRSFSGMSVFARIPARSNTVFLSVYRRTLRFLHSLRLS